MDDKVIQWLLEGDVSLRYQVTRDLLGRNEKKLQERIATEGWGARYLSCRHANGHWGMGFYQPKWTSTHYTLLDLRNLCLPPENHQARQSVAMVLQNHKEQDGGINPAKSIRKSDVCVCGMTLNYACYFGADEKLIQSVVDFILSQQLADGGFNCQSNFRGATHSSLHTTLSVSEGIQEYLQKGYRYRSSDLARAQEQSWEFMLMHRLFRSDKTGKIIKKSFLSLSFPSRWFYDILRAMDHFREARLEYDKRMQDALDILVKKRSNDGMWPLQANHPGKTHFEMESVGRSSRWNTLRALRVLKHFMG
jgi:hypothetical protein